MPPGISAEPLQPLALRSSNSSPHWTNVDASQIGLITPFIGEIKALCGSNDILPVLTFFLS